ncbi:MAG: DUF4838 domain-containing protein [Ruminococcaceae bacterium]|nr:DUF4838 domain-containing protein [Oscillospiraceae bacterium]
MKRTLSLFLAALMLSVNFTACGVGENTETEQTETQPGTEQAETEFAAEGLDFVTENGEARAHIVTPDGAEQLEQYAAEELAYHIKKVSGAEVAVVTEKTGDGLPIIIGTPETVPDLAELFSEDIEWLKTLTDEDGRRWGDDGFAIRRMNEALYIFGATPRGALNGVYDFIEENLGVLWVRANEEIGLVYDEMPTITVAKADYREKSPFQRRGTSFGCESVEGTQILYARNKLNTVNGGGKINKVNGVWEVKEIWIAEHDNLGHCMKFWVWNSPIYDPECTEYWNVDSFGTPIPNEISQINFWSERTLETVTAAILELLSQHPDLRTVPIAIEDGLLEPEHCYNPPYSEQPFEYAPGQFVDPGDKAFYSTVVFTFVNKVAKRVAEEYPDVELLTYAYHDAEVPPLCEIEPNVGVVFCPITGCAADEVTNPENPHNKYVYELAEQWSEYPEVGVDVGIYEYYFSYGAIADYERPIWYKLQSDFRYFAQCGFNCIVSEGSADTEDVVHVWSQKPYSTMWAMNSLTCWIYSKLLWNPEENVDELIEYFCDKVYGDASEHMQEYYSTLYRGWTEGESENLCWNYKITTDFYLDYFVYQTDIEADLIASLRKAYDAADDVGKERIRYIKETYEAAFPEV